MKVLYIEDDAIAIRSMRRAVASLGYELLAAASGQEALELLDAQPDLIFTDWLLPDMDGLLLTRHIHELLPMVPIVALTGIDPESHRQQWMEAGCIALLAKPVDISTLIDTVRTHIRQVGDESRGSATVG